MLCNSNTEQYDQMTFKMLCWYMCLPITLVLATIKFKNNNHFTSVANILFWFVCL